MHVKCLAWRLTFRMSPRYGSNCYHSHGLPEGAWSRPPPALVLPHAVRKKDSLLSTNPQRLQPRLIGQRVPSLHREQKWARDTGAPIQRSPSSHSEGLKSQLASDPQKLGFFLQEFSRRLRDHVCLSCSLPRSNKPSPSPLFFFG